MEMMPETNNDRNLQSLSKFNILKTFDFSSKDPVSKNAAILLFTWCMNAAVGFIFIFIAARMYTIDAVGIATLLFSYSSIVILISRFGIEQSMIRYYDEKKQNSIYCSSILITTVAAIGLGILLIFISYSGLLNSNYLLSYSVVFLIGLLIMSVSQTNGIFFLARGKPLFYLIQNAIIGSRILFLILLIPFGVMGIFCSLILATGFSVFFSVFLILRQGVKFQLPGKEFLIDSFHYSLGNYFSEFFLTAPVFLIPIVVFFISGQNETAIYSVSYAIASLAFLIPASIGFALFMSGCKEKITISSMKTVIVATLVLLIVMISIFFFWGKAIVHLLGPNYSEANGLIVLIMIASIFALFYQIYSAELKIKSKMKELVLLNLVFFIILISMSAVLLNKMGLIGVGYAWNIAYAACMIPFFVHRCCHS